MAAISIPAFVALLFKLALLAYAGRALKRSSATGLYFLLLLVLALHNLVEFAGLNHFSGHGLTHTMQHYGFAYVALLIPAVALILHISLRLSFSDHVFAGRSHLLLLIYLPVIPLEYLLWFTDSLVAGFRTFQYTVLRVPGSWYSAFETYVVVYLLASLTNLAYGARGTRTPAIYRTRNRLWLLALAPTLLLLVYLIVANRFGWTKLTSTVYLPLTLTFFLVVTTYATYQYRLFDIELYIPWSKVRARKTAFYDRIRAMIAEIADLGSVREAVRRLSDTLGCSVALVGTGKPEMAMAGSAQQMTAFPLEQLHRIDRIVVANEIADAAPDTYALMRQHGVAAIVPFYPHSQSASGWMLLGDSFSEQVYTPLDFKMVEQLFDKMAELFLDKLLLMRSQLAATERRLHFAEARLQQTEAGMAALRGEIESLRDQNRRLAREQAADSLIAAEAPEHGALPSIILLGRDKSMLKRLRRHFPQADQYVGPDSASFRRQNLPEVLIGRLDANRAADDAWLALLTQPRGQVAALLYGSEAPAFIAAHLETLAGALVEILPEGATDEAIARRIQALANLRRATRAAFDADCPLVGVSRPFQDTMRDAARLAGFVEPVLIESNDARELTAVARYIHALSGRPGEFHTIPAAEAAAQPARLAETLAVCDGGTLLLTGIEALAPEAREPLLVAGGKTRLLLGVETADDSLRAQFRSFALRLPSLRERRLDLPLLVHYFTLQYNLRAGTQAYLTQADVDELMATRYPANLDALRAEVFDRLNARHRVSAPAPEMELALADKSLDEHVAAFEARLIEQTLERCQGNKSKAARLLGLRPNTLHYKLERYGLGGGSKSKND